MKWTDIYQIVAALEIKYHTIDILTIRFTDLKNWITELPNFNDEIKNCNEKVLEAIQAAWIEERQE